MDKIESKELKNLQTENMSSSNTDDALLDAICGGNLVKVCDLVGKEPNINNLPRSTSYKNEAVNGGHLDILKYLNDTFPSWPVDAFDILKAITKNYPDLVDYCIENVPILPYYRQKKSDYYASYIRGPNILFERDIQREDFDRFKALYKCTGGREDLLFGERKKSWSLENKWSSGELLADYIEFVLQERIINGQHNTSLLDYFYTYRDDFILAESAQCKYISGKYTLFPRDYKACAKTENYGEMIYMLVRANKREFYAALGAAIEAKNIKMTQIIFSWCGKYWFKLSERLVNDIIHQSRTYVLPLIPDHFDITWLQLLIKAVKWYHLGIYAWISENKPDMCKDMHKPRSDWKCSHMWGHGEVWGRISQLNWLKEMTVENMTLWRPYIDCMHQRFGKHGWKPYHKHEFKKLSLAWLQENMPDMIISDVPKEK